MDYDDVINMSAIANTTGKITPAYSRRDISHEIVFSICCMVAFFADVSIIFTMLRFRQMQNVRNILIANWAVTDMCSLLVTPSGYRILSVFYHFSITSYAACIIGKLGAALHYMVILSVIVLLIDWCIAAYFLNCSRRIRAYHKIFLGIFWSLFVLIAILYSYDCKFKYYDHFAHAFITFITLAALTLFIIVLRVVIAVQKCRKKLLEYPKLALHMATCFTMCYVLAFANIIFVDFVRLRHPLFAIVSACLVFCNSIANFAVLYFCDPQFQAHFVHVLKCQFHRYDNQISQLDDHFSEVSFHPPTEQLINNSP